MRYPTAISTFFGIEIVQVGRGTALLQLVVEPAQHGNQQGTIHGGLLVELADAAIGTAHSTLMLPGESFTSIDLHADFLRPVWSDTLSAEATPIQVGHTISRYQCELKRSDGSNVARVISTVMTLRGEKSKGR
ncbi:thioesterase [Psychromicrobium lacuslunae]|uniref:Thioesterase n=2 Tax=Psychromicrobium lacuslunae TaxID=1618207 RepID=A0A0D4C3J5_9MICC|nr:thioesterase [Psychromicrobium lacuslunae]